MLGQTAMFGAVENNQTEIIRYLARHGADPDIGYQDGNIKNLHIY